MEVDQILGAIDAEALARDVLDFVEVKSETGQEGEGSAFLARLLEREGFAVEVDEFLPGRPNIYTRVPGGDGPTLVFNGHTDTIPIGASQAPGREGDWLVGRGTEDMKGGLVAMVHGAAALRRAGVELAGDLWLTGVVGHETPVGKKEGPKRLIELLGPNKIDADAIVIVEGPCAVWSASLGSTIFTVRAACDTGPIHTIKVPYAENPIFWLGKLLQRFADLETEFELAGSHPLCGRERINTGIVRAGDWFNRLPQGFEVTGTWRWQPGKTCAQVRAQLEGICTELAKASGLVFKVELEGFREPFETGAEHGVVKALCAAGERVCGRRPEIVGMGLVGDANLYANAGGVPTVYYGPAHQTAHSDNERVSLAQLVHCAGVYALAALDFCGRAKT